MLSLLPWQVVVIALLVALCVDAAFGEPTSRLHPVVWMGHYMQWAGDRCAPLVADQRTALNLQYFWCAAAAWLLGAAAVLATALSLQQALSVLPYWASSVLIGMLLKPLLALRMLVSEVRAVETALAVSLPAGRERLAWLVSRDVSKLTAAQVRESAIESLAENLNDSVIAPLCWFVFAGLPGAAVYRFANTADAMWGYRGVRGGRVWDWAGKWAARADDMLSWLPARLTALCLVVVSAQSAWSALRQQAQQTPSPNSGWPMAAMALALNISLGKPGVYRLNPKGAEAQPLDTERAINYAYKAVLFYVFITLFVALLAAFNL